MEVLDLIFSGFALFAAGSTLAAMGALFWLTRSRRLSPGPLPAVTILKPLKGLDEHLEANLRGFFTLDYPEYQLVFGVADADDPAIAVVERLIAEFPGRDAELVVGNPPFGLNPKIENLAAMYPRRKHELLLISDSNVRVRPVYLRETVAYLDDPNVGIVTNVFAGVGERKFGAIIENLQLNGFIAANLCGAFVLRITCVVGKSMLMPVRALEAIGGLSAVRNLLAEDQAIGVKVRKAGYSIRLSHHVVDNVNETRDLTWFLNRHSRWLKIRYQMALPTFLLEPLTNLPTIGLIWALVSGSGVAVGGLVALTFLGMLRDAVGSRWLRGTWPRWNHLLLSPLKDLFLLPIWFDALLNRRISWRGHRFIVGRFTRVRSERVSRAARRRLRRVRKVRKLGNAPPVEGNSPVRRVLRIRRNSRPNDPGLGS
jgi:ceramide glucosyltransferase